MCECYKIGGPWITFDPECPAHGYAAQADAEEREAARESLLERIARLEDEVARLSQNQNA